MTEQDHVEIVVELKPGAERSEVERVLRDQGFTTYPLVVGVLATGDAEAARRAFEMEPDGRLKVPDSLAQYVASAQISPPKRMH